MLNVKIERRNYFYSLTDVIKKLPTRNIKKKLSKIVKSGKKDVFDDWTVVKNILIQVSK